MNFFFFGTLPLFSSTLHLRDLNQEFARFLLGSLERYLRVCPFPCFFLRTCTRFVGSALRLGNFMRQTICLFSSTFASSFFFSEDLLSLSRPLPFLFFFFAPPLFLFRSALCQLSLGSYSRFLGPLLYLSDFSRKSLCFLLSTSTGRFFLGTFASLLVCTQACFLGALLRFNYFFCQPGCFFSCNSPSLFLGEDLLSLFRPSSLLLIFFLPAPLFFRCTLCQLSLGSYSRFLGPLLRLSDFSRKSLCFLLSTPTRRFFLGTFASFFVCAQACFLGALLRFNYFFCQPGCFFSYTPPSFFLFSSF